MSEPTFRPLNVGDTLDDDGQIIDDTFKPNPMGITPEQAAFSPVVTKDKEPVKPVRLMGNSLLIAAGAIITDPVQIAWPDNKRKSLTILVTGAVADFVYIADQTTKLAGSQVGPGVGLSTRINSPMAPIQLPHYTGPLFVRTDTIPMSGAVVIQCVSVTE